jgi:G3E family GTPase
MKSPNNPLPICILSGFLGSGKTTLLNNIINSDHGLRIGVLVNDFGEIDIDSQLIVGVEENTISLKNGCICCTIQDEFLYAIVKFLRRPDPPEYLLIETSGVADPSAVVSTLTAPAPIFISDLKVETVVTVVDAAEILYLDDDQYTLAKAQIRIADMVVVNKCDLTEKGHLSLVDEKVRALAPKARMIHTQHGQVSLPIILGEGGTERLPRLQEFFSIGPVIEHPTSGIIRCGRPGHHHRHEHDDHESGHCDCGNHHHEDNHSSLTDAFQSSSYTSEDLMDLEKLREVLKELSLNIYRLKGFFYVDAAPEQRLLVQVVGSRISAAESESWGGRMPRNEVVAIGKRGTIDKQSLAKLFAPCITRDKPVKGKSLVDKFLSWRRKRNLVKLMLN